MAQHNSREIIGRHFADEGFYEEIRGIVTGRIDALSRKLTQRVDGESLYRLNGAIMELEAIKMEFDNIRQAAIEERP
jgi:hypothetical protein